MFGVGINICLIQMPHIRKVVKVGTEDWPTSQQLPEVGSAHVLRWKVEWGDRTVMVPLETASLCPWTLP